VTPHTNLVLATGHAKPVKQNGAHASPKRVVSDNPAFANILDQSSQGQCGVSNGPRLRSAHSLTASTERAALPTHEEAAIDDGADGSSAIDTAERAQEALFVSQGAALAAAIAFPVTATAAKASAAAPGSYVTTEQKDLPDTGARSGKIRHAHPGHAAAFISTSQESSAPSEAAPSAAASAGATTPSPGPAAFYLPLSFPSGEAKSSADLVDAAASPSTAAPLGSSTTAHNPSAEFPAGAPHRKSETSSSVKWAKSGISAHTSSASADSIDKKQLASTKLTSSQTHFTPDPAPGVSKSGAAFAFQLAAAAPMTGQNEPSTPARTADSTPADPTPAGRTAAPNPAPSDASDYAASNARDSETAAKDHKPKPFTTTAESSSLADGIRRASALQQKSAAAPLNANESTGAADAPPQTSATNALFSNVSTGEKASGALETPAAVASLKKQQVNTREDQARLEKALHRTEVSSAPQSAEPPDQADDVTYKAAASLSHAEVSRNHYERGGAFQGSNSQGSGANSEASRKTIAAPDTAFGVSQASSAAPAMGSAAVTGTASPSQQIFDAIRDAAPAASTSSTTASAVQSSPEQPLKVITLALSPANLGTVSIELSLKGDQLGVKIQAGPSAAKLLSQDDGALEKLLKSAGYALQGISVQIVPHSAQSSEATMQPQPTQNSAGTSTSTGDNSGQKQQQRYDGQRAEGRQDRGQGYGHNQERGRGGSLYV
jgi:hypothetical protein